MMEYGDVFTSVFAVVYRFLGREVQKVISISQEMSRMWTQFLLSNKRVVRIFPSVLQL